MREIEIERFSNWLRQRRMNRAQGLALIAAIALVLVVVYGVGRRAAAESGTTTPKRPENQRARMSEEITVHAAGRRNPWINLSDGHELNTHYSGPEELTQLLERNEALPLSLCSADFDEDGVPDLISGYAGPNGGIITLLRGNVDSMYPNAPEAKQRRAEGTFTDAPFLSPAFVFSVPEAADFIGAGDFDGDGHWDVVIASRRSDKLYLMSGDGQGGLRQTKRIDLPGGVTAMVVGEINRRDGLDDIVVGVSGELGAKVLVFEGPEGALRASPETFELPAEATSLALGQLDDSYEIDLAIAAGHELMVVHGRDRKLSLDASRRVDTKLATVDRRYFPFLIRSIALGDFTANNKTEIAIHFEDGALQILSDRNKQDEGPRTKRTLAEWSANHLTTDLDSGIAALLMVRMTSVPIDNLLILDSKSRRLRILAGELDPNKAPMTELASEQYRETSGFLDVRDTPAAALPMRLNSDALSDLVMLTSNHSAQSVILSSPQAVLAVTSTADSGAGSLRQAILDANGSVGADSINFVIPGQGPKIINLQSPLPVVTDAVTIDGTTQPGFNGTPIVALRRGARGSTLKITGGGSTVRGLDICSVNKAFVDLGPADATDIEATTSGGNRIEGNVISEAGIVIRSSNNTVGGTASSTGNSFSTNGNHNGLALTGQGATNNQVQGNSFLMNPNSCAPNHTCPLGVAIVTGAASNNIIGGTTAQARNTISGSPILINQGSGNLIQGNFIGVNASGTVASNMNFGVGVSQAVNTTIGGTTPQARNIISGNDGFGIGIESDGVTPTGHLVQGNYIGTDVTGTKAVGNADGILLAFAKGTTIGGATAAARNIISGNRGNGVQILGTTFDFVIGCGPLALIPVPTTDFQIQGNYIGTDVSGTQPLGNAGDGVIINVQAFSHDIRNNRIAFNGGNGVGIPESNIFVPAFRVQIVGNSIFSNRALGIDLGKDGITANDPLDVDSGANLRQNFPVLLSTSSLAESRETARGITPRAPVATVTVQVDFNSTPRSTFTLQFFFGSNCDGSGQQFTGAIPIPLEPTVQVTTDSNGNARFSFSFDFPTGFSSGFVNSTATDATGNTSEQSSCIAVTNPNSLRITGACKGEGKQLIINGSGFVDGAKILLNGEQEKTAFVSSTQVIAKKAGKRAQTGDNLKVRNPDGSETAVITYTRVNCSP